MFTGLVQGTGLLESRTMSGNAGKLSIRAQIENPEMGESIAVNGTCLTLESAGGGLLTFHVLKETFSRTNLGFLPPGSVVNLERALRAGDRFGGHFVSGHVDCTGKLLNISHVEDDLELMMELPEQIAPYVVPKGSISLDGISLTIADLRKNAFTLRIIPTTWRETNLRFKHIGDKLNLEADMLGKQIRYQLDNMLKQQSGKRSITMDDLRNAGF